MGSTNQLIFRFQQDRSSSSECFIVLSRIYLFLARALRWIFYIFLGTKLQMGVSDLLPRKRIIISWTNDRVWQQFKYNFCYRFNRSKKVPLNWSSDLTKSFARDSGRRICRSWGQWGRECVWDCEMWKWDQWTTTITRGSVSQSVIIPSQYN